MMGRRLRGAARDRKARGWRVRNWRILVAPIALLGLAMGVLPATPAFAATGVLTANVTITDTSGNPISIVDASAIAAYRVNIAYSCSVADCTGAQVKVAAPPTDPYYGTSRKETAVTYTPPFTPAPALTGSIAAGYTINLGTVTAGTNGLIRLDYTVNTRNSSISTGNFFPDGSPITPTATMTASNASTVTAAASATWKSYINTPSLTISAPAVVTAGTQMTVATSGSSGCWSAPTGVLRSIPWFLCNNTGYQVVQLPANAVYVPGSGGTYDAATNQVTLTSPPKSWTGVGGSFKVVFPTANYPTSGAGCTATEKFVVIDAKYTYLDGTVKATSPATAEANVTVGNCAPFAKADFGKSSKISGAQFNSASWVIPTAPSGSYVVQWFTTASNQANVPGVATIVDNALDQADLPVTSVSVTAGGPATIQYTLDNGTTGTATNVNSYTAPAGRRIVAVTATSSTLAGPNIRPTDAGATPFTLVFSAVLSNTATPGTRTNTASATMTYPANPALGTIVPTNSPASRTVALVAPSTPYTINASNVGVTPGVALPDSEVVWTANGSAGNVTSTTSWTPQYVFLAPLGWTIDPNGASLATPVPGATFSYKTVTYAGQSYQAVIVNWPSPVTGTGTVTLPVLSVKTTPGSALAGPSTSRFFVGDAANAIADVYNATRVVDATDIDVDGVTTDVFAAGSGVTTLAASPLIGVSKQICKPNPAASDGCDWVANPGTIVGVTPGASSIKYRVILSNIGNSTLTNMVAYDVLPYIGDTGTSTATATTPRGSTVQETLATVSNATSGVALAYSTSTNPPRPEVYSGATSGIWTAPLVGASSIRATVASLAPGQSQSFVYTASLVNGSADQIACNSIAANAPTLAAVEPAPVCATTQEADLSVQTASRFPLQEGRVGTVPFVVNNGGGSQFAPATVTLTVPDGLSIVDLTVPGWSCTAPSMTGPVTVTCAPVKPDGTTTRPLALNAPETIPLKLLPASGTGQNSLCIDASITGLINDPQPANNQATSCAALVSGTGLVAVSKTDGVTSATPGSTLTYTVTAANKLVAEALTGAVVTDTLPSNVAFVSASNGGTLSGADGNGNGGTVTWPAVNLAAAGTATGTGATGTGEPGSTVTRTITVRVTAGATGDVVNKVAMAAPDPAAPSQQLTASGSDTDSLQRLTVTKTSNAAPSGVRTGDNVTYTVVLTNDGTADYTAGNPATVLDNLSAVLDDATYVSGTAAVNGGSTSPITPNGAKHLVWSGALTAGSHVTLTYTVAVGAGADKMLTNTAWASGAVGTSCQNGVDQSGISCASVQSVFAPVIGKRIQSFSQNDDGTWQIVYAIDVTNPSPVGSSTYGLADTLRFGAGIQVLAPVTITPPAGMPTTWDGTGSATLASGATIASGAQQTYLVSVRADAHQTIGTAAATCAAGVAGGFANSTTLTLAGRTPIAAEACVSPAAPTITKTVATPVQQPDGSWNVVYTVSVVNSSRSTTDLAYTVGDAIAFPVGTVVNSVQVTGAGSNPAFNGTSTTQLTIGVQRIPAPAGTASSTTRDYTVTVNVNAPLGVIAPADLLCGPAGSGGYANTATLFAGTSTTALGSASACAPVTVDPMPTITKEVVSSAVGSDGNWALVYRIVVTNGDDTYATHYALNDSLNFAAGVSAVSAQMTAPAGVDPATWDGSANAAVFPGTRTLAAGASDTYTATVVADPGALDALSAAADCRIDAGESGTGFRNVATVTVGGKSVFADACEPATDPSVVKTTVGQPAQDPATGEWTTKYRIAVTNRSTTTVGTIPYTVDDTLAFPTGVTVLDVSATDPAGDPVTGFDGAGNSTLGSGAIGAASDATDPASQVWDVTVRFAVPAGLSNVPACDPAQGPGGLRNEAEIHIGQRVSGSVACADVPDVPAPVMSKSLVSQKQNADGTWAVVYRIDVQNPSATAASTYTLDDDLAFGSGISLLGDATVDLPAAVASTAWNGHNSADIVSDLLLPAGGSHSYTVRATVDAGSVTSTDAAGDCTLAAGETGTGFLNTAMLDTGAVQLDRSACATTFDPAVTKQLNGQPVQQPDGSWLLSYTMTVANPSNVQLSYGLVDELAFPAGSDISVESAASRAGGPAVLANWDGQNHSQLVADGTDLAPNAVHVYDVTVRATLPAGQLSTTGGWANTATVESGTGNVISANASAVADVSVPQLTVDKTVTAGPVVRIGDQVTYQLVVHNIGDGDFTALYPAVVRDDLSGVLDDATLVGLPAVTPALGDLTSTGDGFHWSGALSAGSSVTIDYTVTTIRGGDADLVNTAFQAQPLDTDPAPPATCAAPTCAVTDTPMPALNIAKTVRESSVAPGGTLHYTVTVTNVGKVDIPSGDPATATDDLSGVLNHAVYTGDASASTGQVTFSGMTLTWTGALATGQSATITYSVKVRADTVNGIPLLNRAASDPTLAALTLTGAPASGRVTTTSLVVLLARTGVDILASGIGAGIILLLGALAVTYAARRRRRMS